MAISPQFKIYQDGTMIGAARTLELAIKFMTVCRASHLKANGRNLWRTTKDGMLFGSVPEEQNQAYHKMAMRLRAANIEHLKKCGLSDAKIEELIG